MEVLETMHAILVSASDMEVNAKMCFDDAIIDGLSCWLAISCALLGCRLVLR